MKHQTYRNTILAFFRRKKEGYRFFSMLGNSKQYKNSGHWIIMTIALIPLLLVQQVSRGMIEGITERIIETDSYHLLFQPYDENILKDKHSREEIISEIQNIQGIKSSYAEVRGLGIIRKDAIKSGISIRGVSHALLQDEGIKKYIELIEGRLTFEKNNEVILGKAVSEKLRVKTGDQVLILTTRADNINSLPKITKNTVVGIVSTGYEELDRSWVLTSVQRATEILSPTEISWYIGIKIDDPFILDNDLVTRSKREREKGQRIVARVEEHVFREGTVSQWYSLNYNRYSLFVDTKKILSLAMMIAVFLAAVTLSSTMSMKIIDMDSDIAILKGIGASSKKLERQVFMQGLRYGIIGSVIGCLVGIMFMAQINNIIFLIDFFINITRSVFGYTNPISILNPQYYLTQIPFRLYLGDMVWIILFTVVLSVLAAWMPVRHLRKISALKIIRQH